MDKATLRVLRHFAYGAVTLAAAIFLATLVVLAAFKTDRLAAFTVVGDSMAPTLADGETVIYHPEKLKQGDIVLFKRPPLWQIDADTESPELIVKRVAAAPGDTISFDGKAWLVNGKKLYTMPANYECTGAPFTQKIAANEFVAFGDNSLRSLDSRRFFCGGVDGLLIPTSLVIGSGDPLLSL